MVRNNIANANLYSTYSSIDNKYRETDKKQEKKKKNDISTRVTYLTKSYLVYTYDSKLHDCRTSFGNELGMHVTVFSIHQRLLIPLTILTSRTFERFCVFFVLVWLISYCFL